MSKSSLRNFAMHSLSNNVDGYYLSIRDEKRLLQCILELLGEIDELYLVVKPLAELLQDHNRTHDDNYPLFGVNGKLITIGDARRAERLLRFSNDHPFTEIDNGLQDT